MGTEISSRSMPVPHNQSDSKYTEPDLMQLSNLSGIAHNHDSYTRHQQGITFHHFVLAHKKKSVLKIRDLFCW
jgi:hypothetical protein